ncbi:hypothetical protein NM688_g4601 [Phlebia brevispora]|uniref:Uncharacterized protein n=1 Tax=Phlebia brevispora TaxID=194682 RepID=A0ACC1T2I2_9APHY|nr:hypothetical protein NM688_g4601 [Phlebia brevispora]
MSVIAHGVRTLGVLGAGQMGLGIAYVAALRARVPVLLHDRSPVQIQKGLALMDKLLEKDTAKVCLAQHVSRASSIYLDKLQGKITSEEAKEARARVTVVSPEQGLSGLRDVDMVIEAVSENLELKKAIFRNLSAELNPSAILATNTSSISITKIASSTIPDGQTAASEAGRRSASRVVGLHFFNPVPVMGLVLNGSADAMSVSILSVIKIFMPNIALQLHAAKPIGSSSCALNAHSAKAFRACH